VTKIRNCVYDWSASCSETAPHSPTSKSKPWKKVSASYFAIQILLGKSHPLRVADQGSSSEKKREGSFYSSRESRRRREKRGKIKRGKRPRQRTNLIAYGFNFASLGSCARRRRLLSFRAGVASRQRWDLDDKIHFISSLYPRLYIFLPTAKRIHSPRRNFALLHSPPLFSSKSSSSLLPMQSRELACYSLILYSIHPTSQSYDESSSDAV
jgi:hypothetical protein